jgi:hypothetical protein
MSTPKPTVGTQIIPYLFHRDVPAALDWLARAFGFVEEMRHATPGGMHAQMTLDGQRIMMGTGSKDWGMLSPHETKSATEGIFVYLANVCRCALRTSTLSRGGDRRAARRILRPHLRSARHRRPSLVLHRASRRALTDLNGELATRTARIGATWRPNRELVGNWGQSGIFLAKSTLTPISQFLNFCAVAEHA